MFSNKKYDMQTCLWKHLDYDACSSSTVIKKEASKKPVVELNSDVLPVNWILFYHTAYDIKQITWMHNIDVTLQQVSAQKNANNASEHIQLRASVRKRERVYRGALSTARCKESR